MDWERYLLICEELGEEPDPKRMPLDTSFFPGEVQLAFFIYGHLTDIWEFQSGIYLGKDWGQVEYLFKLYEIDNPKVIIFFMKLYEKLVVEKAAKDTEQKRKKEQRQAGSDNKTYTHNIRG